jgi:hypothetical protein
LEHSNHHPRGCAGLLPDITDEDQEEERDNRRGQADRDVYAGIV